jgi:hypothetical protein
MKNRIKLALIRHRTKLKAITEVARSIAEYAVTKSNFSLISGGLVGIERLAEIGSNDPTTFFSPINGWAPLTEHEPVQNVFLSTLAHLTGERLPFDYDNVKLFDTPHGQFAVLFDRFNTTEATMLAKADERVAILGFLGDMKLRELNTNALSLDEITLENRQPNLILSKFTLNPVSSPRADDLIEEIQKCLDNNFHRSILLHGLPGTGKTTLAHTVIDHFGFRTLKIHPNDSIKLPYFMELIKLLKIEALILDDFDQIEMNDKLLEFLQVVNKDMKLVFGIANMLDGFDPAVLRPERFDEIKKIEELEESTLIELLGELREEYFDKVRGWPIAYIKELVKQSIVNPEKLQDKCAELNERVEKLRASYEVDKDDEDSEEE